MWYSTALSKHLKWRLLETTVIPIFMYGCETWTISTSIWSAIDVFHRKCLRSNLSIRWFDRARNSTLYPVLETQSYSEKGPAKKTAASWTRSATSGGCLLSPDSPGRPRLTWRAQVSGFLPLAQDRRRFLDLVATVT